MAVDYLSTLNSKGSGLNVTQLVDSIVAAEIEPAKQLISDKASANDLSISEMAKFRSSVAGFQTALNATGEGGLFSVNSSTSSITMTVTDAAKLSPGQMSVKVNQIAMPQVLEFTGYTAADQSIPTGAMTVEIGTWSPGGDFVADTDRLAQTVTISSGNATLSGLAAALGSLTGVSARVLDKGDGTFSLSTASETGAASALKITVASGGPTGFATPDQSNEISSALDAEIVVDGITVYRSANSISDLVSGATLDLKQATSNTETLNVSKDKTAALSELQGLVDQINTMRSYLDKATARGLNGAEPGALAGDAAIASIKRQLMEITTSPLTGFGEEPVYLSEVGVQTNRDGTLSVDTSALNDALDANPEKFQAIFKSATKMSASNLQVSFAHSASPPEGAFEFDYDSVSDTATLNGISLSSRENNEGGREFYKLSGDFYGLVVKVIDGDPQDSKLYVGASLVDQLADYLEQITASKGDLSSKEAYYSDKSARYDAEIVELDEQAMVLEAREFKRFAAMESMVTRLKSTGDYITTMMDAWNKPT